MRSIILLLFISLTVSLAGGLAAEEPQPAENESPWRVDIAVYGWLAGTKGDVYTSGEHTQLDVPADVFVDMSSAGFQGAVELGYDWFFVNFDGTWATLETSADGVLLDLDVEIKQRIYDVTVGARVWRSEEFNKYSSRSDTHLDLFIGGRYFFTEPKLA